MKKLLIFTLVAIRIFVMIKVSYLLFKSTTDEENFPVENLTWWIYYLIFDIWIVLSFKFPEESDKE